MTWTANDGAYGAILFCSQNMSPLTMLMRMFDQRRSGLLCGFVVVLLFLTCNVNAWIRHSYTVRRSKPSFHRAVTIDETDSEARSAFGTKDYWDDVYAGRGDFPADEYSWYYGWDVVGKHIKTYIPNRDAHILLPGIGNDPMLLDLNQAGYKRMTAQDYSEHAIERQRDLLSYEYNLQADIDLMQGDVRQVPFSWANSFDAIVEKGMLDAVYLSGDGNVEQAAENLYRVLKPGGICVSVSGVVPEDLREQLFAQARWEWLRDGSTELKAGCFIFQKKAL